MKVSKRLIYLVLSIALIITSIPFLGYAETPNDFPDLPDDWSREALIKAVNNGLLTGANGKLMPLSDMTRAQFAAVINKAFGATRMASLVEFTDVKASDWYFRDLAIAYQMGTFSGSNGKMNPNKPITREEVFVVLAKAFQLPLGNERSIMKFRDSADVADWAKPYVAAMIDAGYINGSNGLLNPKKVIKRNEAAAVMDNVVKHYITEPGIYTGTFNGNIIIRVPGVTFQDAVINGSLVVADGVGTGQVVFEGVEVKGATLIRGQAQVVETPGNPDVPVGPGTPPVVIPPNNGGGDGGGVTPPPPVVTKDYGFRVTYKSNTYLEEINYAKTKTFTFDVLEDIRAELEDTIIAEINDPTRTSFIEDLLVRVNPNTAKTYAEGIATRVLANKAGLVVFNKDVYVADGTGIFVRIKAKIDASQPVTVELIRELAAELIKEDTLKVVSDLETLYPTEKITDHVRVFFYSSGNLVEDTDVLLVDLMDEYESKYKNLTLESLVGKQVLKFAYGDKEVIFQVVDDAFLNSEK